MPLGPARGMWERLPRSACGYRARMAVTPVTDLVAGGVDNDFDALMLSSEPAMHVVTCADGDDLGACLVGFGTQSSIEPRQFTVWISRANHTGDVAARSLHLGVHLLRSDQRALARHFGELTGDEVNKFQSVSWTRGPHGVPVLTDCDWFVGTIVDRIRAATGDHDGYVLEPTATSVRRAFRNVLTYDRVRDLEPGHAA
jgi:flavin reductase (DIM6/NTAB) family NADH-FMN oxidoreductase RutF